MQRRDFLKTAAMTTGGTLFLISTPTILRGADPRTAKNIQPPMRFTIHGNKRLGCSGFDFPNDPSILDTGKFMP